MGDISMDTLLFAVQVVGYAILALVTLGVIIKIASVYARYMGTKKSSATIDINDKVVLSVEQEKGTATIICAKVDNLPDEAAIGGEEA